MLHLKVTFLFAALFLPPPIPPCTDIAKEERRNAANDKQKEKHPV